MLITTKEKNHLRDLAKLQKELASTPENKLREQNWYLHNDFKGTKPLIVFEDWTFWDDIKPESKCKSIMGKFLEDILHRNIVPINLIKDDRVIPDAISIDFNVWHDNYGVQTERTYSEDSKGRQIGYSDRHVISNIEKFEDVLRPSNFYFDRDDVINKKNTFEDIIGDILPIKANNRSLVWVGLTETLVKLAGMGTFFEAMYDCPDSLHKLMAFLCNEKKRFALFQEENGLLSSNWDNFVVCGSSYAFTKRLPKSNPTSVDLVDGPTNIKLSDQWVNMNSQETVGVSPQMYKEFILPYYKEIASLYGQVYYGCCEPVHEIFENGVETIENLRKISISPWCNQQIMADYLKGKEVVFSRKISPNYLGITSQLDEEAFKNHIDETLIAARGLTLELLQRDVYDLNGNVKKLARAVEIIRERIEEKYYY